MAKIVVTGGAGFIGSHLVDGYVKAGHEVIVIDNLETGSKTHVNSAARFYEMDICDPSLEEIVASERPVVVNHHAAQASISRSVADPVHDARTNILGTVRLLELGRKYGRPGFIFASSGGAVYGHQQWYPASEDHPLSPTNAYGIAKLTVEKYLAYYWDTHQIRSISLRYGNVYGPRQNPLGEAGVVAIFIGALLCGKRPVIYGDGHQTRDFVHVRDVVRANILALDLLLSNAHRSNRGCEAVNIGTGRETSVLEILNRLASVVKASPECDFESPREGEIRRSCLDIAWAHKLLNWTPTLALEEGLRETADWFLKENIQVKRN